MTAQEIRQTFLDFFESKNHKIVPSAPIVNKNDPTLMFTNAGMNQFKDYFLGNATPPATRIADTQKCLRVSGKHNDLEEVGRDSYHHTMFEMLGNWSFGDYFKKEAINWAWELLTEKYGLPKDRLYASVFEGDSDDGLPADEEAKNFWLNHLPEGHILYFDKKDNFWEMGDTGPCGPCSEIHIDLRSDEERAKVPGRDLVNMDSPLVVEIWNLVFIQFDRKADGKLVSLPSKHVDTGMGFERLCMAMQQKKSNYETDVFTPFIKIIEAETGVAYTNTYDEANKTDIAIRVLVDHIRAVAFSIADGSMPSNTGAGYVIRRILRRAVRYYYSFLNVREPLLVKLIPLLAERFQDVFPELKAQETFVSKVIQEEELSFLRTLEAGIKRFESIEPQNSVLPGEQVFELYDTFGFPVDLTRLMAQEKGLSIDEKGFETALAEQKNRSKADAKKSVGDWHELIPNTHPTFVGYDQWAVENVKIAKYRSVEIKGKSQFQLVLDVSPFYPEGGGQVGDKGILKNESENIEVVDTIKENDLPILIVKRLPKHPEASFRAEIYTETRSLTQNNHSATHLMHAALKQVLGAHVNQKGSLNNDKYLRFDFSHFQKVSQEELTQVEAIVNEKIRANIPRGEYRDMPLEEAKKEGAMMLFGEKYGETVRMITFGEDFSKELCGGCHVNRTGDIGYFKIVNETAVASGVRRIEAVTAVEAEKYLHQQASTLNAIKLALKGNNDPAEQVVQLLQENKDLRKELEKMQVEKAALLSKTLLENIVSKEDFKLLISKVAVPNAQTLKTIAQEIEKQTERIAICFAADFDGKPQLLVLISKTLADEKKWHAGKIVKEAAKHIKGGGGGQPFFATAGGQDASGLDKSLETLSNFFDQ